PSVTAPVQPADRSESGFKAAAKSVAADSIRSKEVYPPAVPTSSLAAIESQSLDTHPLVRQDTTTLRLYFKQVPISTTAAPPQSAETRNQKAPAPPTKRESAVLSQFQLNYSNGR